MSYTYQQQSHNVLETLAALIIERSKRRCIGHYVDIEGIVEDTQITILPRRGGLEGLVRGYSAQDPRYILMPETDAQYPPRYRYFLAHEFCHKVLEYKLFEGGALPQGANEHELTSGEHLKIEDDAHYLARAILFQRKPFEELFQKWVTAKVEPKRAAQIRQCMENMEREFQVWNLQAAYRARDLRLIAQNEGGEEYSHRLML